MDQNPLKNQAASLFPALLGTHFFKKATRIPGHKRGQDEKARRRQSGSIFVWIFIMIALFAAISFVLLQNSRTSVDTLSGEQAKLATTEILGYAQKLRETVQNLRIDGCDDTQISFAGEPSSGYDYSNPNAPGDGHCEVFGVNGGGLRWPAPPFQNSGWFITATHCYEGAGSSQTCSPEATELELNLIDIPDMVCAKINESAGSAAGVPQENYNAAIPSGRFTGTYNGAGGEANQIEGIGAAGKIYGCYKDNSGPTSGQNIFYYILIAR